MHCPHADRCPGCALIGLDSGPRLERKRSLVASALAGYPELSSLSLPQTLPADPETGYRVRAKLVANGRALGLFGRGSHEVVDIPECLILRPRLKAVAQALREALPRLGGVSSIDLRETDQGVIVTLALPERASAAERERIATLVAGASPYIVTVATSRRERNAPRVLGSAPAVAHGPAEARHTFEAGAPYHYASPGAFTQVHTGQAARLQRAIEDAVLGMQPSAGKADTAGGATRVLELYGGSGALALRLARAGADVTLVESFPPAVALAARAAREQALELVALTSDAASALGTLGRTNQRFDVVIANPPRRGLEPDVRRGIAALAPQLFVYVSCDPHTFARDAAHFARMGLELAEATPLDMIPLSDAVETFALFRPAEPARAPVLLEAATFRVVDHRGHEASETEPSGAYLVSLDPTLAAPELATARYRAVALVRGVIRARGSLALGKRTAVGTPATFRYERRELIAGHSLIELTQTGAPGELVLSELARVGHPVLGAPRHGDPRSNAHFEHRHGLDRAFFHVSELSIGVGEREQLVQSELSPDLARVLANLRAGP